MSESKEVAKSTKEPPIAPKKIAVVKKNDVIILKLLKNVLDGSVEELEKKYSNKFGCKVIILENNLQFVDVLDG